MDNRTLISGMEHVFNFYFHDVYGNNISSLVNIDPPFLVHFKDESGGYNEIITTSYQDQIKGLIRFKFTPI